MPVADITGSMTALAAILMALLRRERTGRGDVIDISMQVAAMAWLLNVTGPVFAGNRAPVVKEERSFGGYAFLQTCECADGRYVALGGVEHKFVENFLNAVGRPDLIPAACGPNGPGQVPVIAALKALFLTRTRDAWVDRAAGKGLAFAPVLDLREAFAQPQVAARGMLMRDDGSLPRIGSPVKYRDEPGEPDLRLPGLGEHSGDYR
jgi:crotonobetainyl-CoA:carnitine CoA-transferase CaiB-like acyl-CoA transferase